MTSKIAIVDLTKCGLLIENDQDISEQAFRDIGDQLCAALSSLGVAYLSNHGIMRSDIDGMNDIADAFFERPAEEKMPLYKHDLIIAYDPVGKTKGDMKNPDQQEGFRASGAAYEDENTKWPDVPGFKQTYFNFASKAGSLLFRLFRALGFGLKLKDKDYFMKVHSLINKKGNLTAIKTARYPPVPTDDALPPHKLRVGAHRDIATLVLLFQDSIGGLQVEDENGQFIDVEPIPGTIVLNIGETLETWTGNRIKAAVHRVCPPVDPVKRNKIRRSVIYFGQANDDALMEKVELENEDENNETPSKDPLTVAQFMKKRFDELFD